MRHLSSRLLSIRDRGSVKRRTIILPAAPWRCWGWSHRAEQDAPDVMTGPHHGKGGGALRGLRTSDLGPRNAAFMGNVTESL